MNSQIIELSSINARQKISNGEWITNLQKPFTLNPADQITIRQSIIDANLAGDYNNLAIANDIQASLTFGYYYVNDAVDLDFGMTVDTAEKLGIYIARDSSNTLITNNKTFTIPAGNYDAASMAEFVSAQVSKLPSYQSIDQFAALGGGIIEPMLNSYEIGCESFRSSAFGFNSVLASSPFTTSQIEFYVPNAKIYVYWKDNSGSQQKTENEVLSIDIPTQTVNFVNDIPLLETDNFVTDVFLYLEEAIPIKFYNQSYKANSNDWITAKSIDRFMGTNEFALEYNVNNTGRFQFSQFHMSPYTSDTDADQCISVIQYNSSGSLFFLDTRTGLFFTDMSPASFWFDTLGFNSSMLVVDNQPALQLQTRLTRGVNITSNYLGADALIGATRTNAKIPLAIYFYKTTLTNAIIASNDYISQDIGYVLIEISAIPTDYNSEIRGLSSGVIQICSNAYDNNGFITCYSDTALSFINNSENPIQYGSFRVRILNPQDMSVVQTLGPRTTVFLELIRAQLQPK
jgi:hypothetical protein